MENHSSVNSLYVIERDSIVKNYEHFGYWWANGSIELIKIGERVFALNGWDGESYKHCWECQNYFPIDGLMEVKNKTVNYNIKPIYLYQLIDIDLSELDQQSDEWNTAHEITQYIVTRL